MVVILILPSTTSSTSGCDEFNYSNQRHKHQHRHRHTAHNDHHAQSRATNCRSQGGQPAKDACYVRHVTRINISDVYSQVEVDGDSEPVTKEEEVVTKKKTELTTTKQIETRVKRQVVLEDGKVVQDSGPIVETNTTEDTDKQESESVERRNLGDGIDAVDGPKALDQFPSDVESRALIEVPENDNSARTVLAPRADGLVRESKTQKVVSREEIQERTEVEDIKHLGDFSDEAYVKAISSGVENIQEVLLSPEAQKQLVSYGPRLVSHTTKARKTIDTEDTDLKCLAKPDGTLVTEKKQTTEHEELVDDQLPEEDDHSTGSRERIDHKSSTQRFAKRRDEQEVEYVADGKTIKKEMRYAAETEDIERDGPPEDASDWDSLSDRVRKARLKQKTLLQQHREALQNERERKEALTKRPIDFEKEEETRKDETIKWLENHFGSDSSRDNDNDDNDTTKKSFFNVTIKSNAATAGGSPIDRTYVPHSSYQPPSLQSPAKAVLPEREVPKAPKYFQGISEWAERKESTPRNFSTKTFHDELKGTLERNRIRNLAASREEIRPPRYGLEEIVKSDDEARKKSIKHDIRYGSRGDLHYSREMRGGSDDSRNLKVQKEDLGYMSGSRNDMHLRHDSKDDLYAKSKKQSTGYLHREDSGYVKDSHEDIRYSRNVPVREDSFNKDSGEDEKLLKYNNAAIQRDDSAYVSSSTYFTEPRSPKSIPLRTPDSGIRSPSPELYDSETLRPSVPQRKRVIEKKMRPAPSDGSPSPPHHRQIEPPPDYSPPSRSRSISPAPSPKPLHHSNHKKMYQKTRFASSSELSRPISTQTIETQTTPPKKNKVGSSIGNSIRKLVGKIRSASVERKLKAKAKRSASPSHAKQTKQPLQQPFNQVATNGGSTYQQYNVIDSHIGSHATTMSPSSNRDSSIASARHERATLDRRASPDVDAMAAIPKQKYYLGEDPYLSIYGKENKYDGNRPQRYQNQRRQRFDDVDASYHSPSRVHQTQTSTTANTLGRFSKSTNRLQSSPSHIDYDYRSAQTLPRKLEHKPLHSSAINIAIVNNVRGPSASMQNTGPAKPARSYKSLNRSKSFNVHGLNGTNDPSPIYLEKLNRNVSHRALYRSNPHLNEEKPQLRSPSIVNLVSRSQRDLTKIDENPAYNGNGHGNYISGSSRDVRRGNSALASYNQPRNGYSPIHYTSNNLPTDRRAQSLLRTASDNYRTEFDSPSRQYRYGLERNIQRERESSLGSRSPITINKDTAAIIRRGSSSTEDYSETYKTTSKSDDPYRPSITNTVHNFTKKTIPGKSGRGPETIETSERKSVTTSRYRNGEPNLRYIPQQEKGRKSSGPIVIEVRNGASRK